VFTWTIAYAPKAGMGAGKPLNNRILRTLFADTRKHWS
jgi:hypothetical protein